MSKSKTQYAILGALSIKPMSGYEIKKMMAESTDYFWSESNGQLYPTLAKLAKNKCVTFKIHKTGQKSRKIYAITSAGKNKLKKWLIDDPDDCAPRNELLLKLFYGHNVTPDICLNHIKKYREKCKQSLTLYKNIEETLEAMVKQKKRPVYFLLTVKAGINIVKTEMNWCEDAITLINKYT